jgi:hypothetical protein
VGGGTDFAKIGGELFLEVHVNAKLRQELAVASIEGLWTQDDARQYLALGELVVAIVVVVDAKELL